MNGVQKVIKYCAMAFAIFLAVTILGAIVSVVLGVTTGIAGVNFLMDGDEERINLSEEYTLEEAKELGISDILVDCNAEIVVKQGEVLAIEAENVTDDYKIRQTNGKFSIVQDRPHINIVGWFDGNLDRERVVVTIPMGLVAEELEVLAGSGSVTLTGITIETLTLDSGSGKVATEGVTAERMYVKSGSGRISFQDTNVFESGIKTGSGGVVVKDSKLGKLTLDTGSGTVRMENVEADGAQVDTGSGSVSIDGVLTGTCEFETGSGSLTIRLNGNEEDYRVKADCGSGTFRINGKKRDEGSYGTNIKGELLIDAGSGSVNVEFDTLGEE